MNKLIISGLDFCTVANLIDSDSDALARFAALIAHFAFLPPIMPGLIEIISLKSRIDVFPDEVYFGLHIFDVCCGDYHGILVRNHYDVLAIGSVCP